MPTDHSTAIGAKALLAAFLATVDDARKPDVQMKEGSTMDEKSISGTIEKTTGGTGAWPDLCKKVAKSAAKRLDFVLSDSGSGTSWTMDDGRAQVTQELFVTRDMCKPRHFCLLNIFVNGKVYHGDKYESYMSLKKSPDWDLVVEGPSASVGCADTMFDDRFFACFMKKDV